MVISGDFGGIFGIFRVPRGPRCEKIGAYAKFGNLQWFKWIFSRMLRT
jgi:hypothetical protein